MYYWSASQFEYWEKLPADTHLATMLCSYQKTQPLIHQASTAQALVHGKMSTNRIAKLQADLVDRHIELLRHHEEIYQMRVSKQRRVTPPPINIQRRRTADADVW